MQAEILKYTALSDEELFKAIGEVAIEENGLQGFDTIKDKLKIGKKLFKEYKESLHDVICKNEKIKKALASEELSTGLNLTSLIVSIISKLVLPGTIILIAVLIVRYGLIKYCEF